MRWIGHQHGPPYWDPAWAPAWSAHGGHRRCRCHEIYWTKHSTILVFHNILSKEKFGDLKKKKASSDRMEELTIFWRASIFSNKEKTSSSMELLLLTFSNEREIKIIQIKQSKPFKEDFARTERSTNQTIKIKYMKLIPIHLMSLNLVKIPKNDLDIQSYNCQAQILSDTCAWYHENGGSWKRPYFGGEQYNIGYQNTQHTVRWCKCAQSVRIQSK